MKRPTMIPRPNPTLQNFRGQISAGTLFRSKLNKAMPCGSSNTGYASHSNSHKVYARDIRFKRGVVSLYYSPESRLLNMLYIDVA
jgi:hypothetical protein